MPAIKKYIDLKLILLLAGFYTLFDIIYVGKMAYFRHHFPRGDEEPWGDILLYTILIDWLVVVTYMSLIAISTKRLLNKTIRGKRSSLSTRCYP
jgi:two-component system, LytTR family, sensor kinase